LIFSRLENIELEKRTNLRVGSSDFICLNLNKEITEILYNQLNLPTEVYWSAAKKINYLYPDAFGTAGQKVKKTVRDGNTIKNVEYLDGFQYAGGILQFFPTAEGYVRATEVTRDGFTYYAYDYVYNYTDHLDERNQSTALIEVCERSSVRLSYSKDPATGELKIL